MPLRVAAIDFLNPAPLMWDFHHAPHAQLLAERYTLDLTKPSECARRLLAGEADLGLIPIAALTPALRIVPGCTIASPDRVRSILLLAKVPLDQIRSVAADTASRSSVAYTELILKEFHANSPRFMPAPADPVAMLREHDAALLIGDPALLALEARAQIERQTERQIEGQIEGQTGPLAWHDIAHLWHTHTRLPWVAAVWAVRADLKLSQREREQLFFDLNASRKRGLENIETLVADWTPRIAIPPATIRTYLTENIHYLLDAPVRQAIGEFRSLAARHNILPALDPLPFLEL